MKLKFLALFVVLGVIGGAWWYSKKDESLPPQNTTTETPGTLSGASYQENEPYYRIEARFPSSVPLEKTANAQATATMKAYVDETIAQFKKDGDFDTLTAEDAERLGISEGRQWELKIMYLVASSTNTLSYIFNSYEYTGGAHGNTTVKTFTFDTTSGKLLSLSDLFSPPRVTYLGNLTQESRRRLPGVIGADADKSMIDMGTEPTADSFKNFFFDGTNFVLIFQPYQVGPYVLGTVTLPIPTKDLKAILKPEYQ